MDCSKDYFVEISLDSVLRKATELENSLRICRSKAEVPIPDEGYKSHLHLGPPFPRQPSTNSTLTQSNGVSSTENIADNWQKLTAYIVSLEKEVQHYRELAQDVQTVNGHESTARSPEEVLGLANECKQDSDYWKIRDLQSHALLLVFSYMSTRDLCQISLVCRKWFLVSRHPSLWKNVVLTETIVNAEVLIRMAQWCSSTERLFLHGLMPPLAACDEDLQSYINNTRGSLEPGIKAMMESNSLSLTSLTITECNLMATERVLWLASVHCPNLHSFTYSSEEFPSSSESLWSLANGCRHLQHLTLPPLLENPNAHWFNDNCLMVIAHAWPLLLSLTVGGHSITPQGLREIAHKCQKLQYLEIIHGPSLHKGAMELLCTGGFQSLNEFALNFTPASYTALKFLFESCTTLKSVEMHVTLSCYFSSPIDSETVSKYNTIITNIKKLKNHPRGREIFKLYEH